jgi:hypothetical protein
MAQAILSQIAPAQLLKNLADREYQGCANSSTNSDGVKPFCIAPSLSSGFYPEFDAPCKQRRNLLVMLLQENYEGKIA